MSDNSKIEWTEATWNPTRGCTRISEGCRHCYAEGIAARFSGRGKPFEGFAKVTAPRDALDRDGGRRNGWTGRVELIPDKLTEPLSWRKPRKVFVNSMSDLFHEALPDEAIDQVFAVMVLPGASTHATGMYRPHTFQILTKRADRMREYMATPDRAGRVKLAALRLVRERQTTWGTPFEWPLPNVWLGVSVENQHFADERIPLLLQTPAAVRFISAEPLLGPVLLDNGDTSWFTCTPHVQQREGTDCCMHRVEHRHGHFRGLDWVIVGGESGHGARPFDIAWARSIVQQCQAAGVPVFVKQLGAKAYEPYADGTPFVELHLQSKKGGDPLEWPADLRVREFPAVSDQERSDRCTAG